MKLDQHFVGKLFNVKSPHDVTLYPSDSERARLERNFRGKFKEELKLGAFVSYSGNKKIPFLRLYRYKEAFSYNLVKEFLKRFEATEQDYVFDPFSGLGTTLFTSMLSGIPSIGIDKLPIAYFVSMTLPKFLLLKEGEMKKLWEKLKKWVDESDPADVALDVPIMRNAFSEENLLLLRKMKSAILKLDSPFKELFLLLFFSILEECSFTSKDGQFLRLKRDKQPSHPIEAMQRKVVQVEEDVSNAKLLYSGLTIDENIIPKVEYGDTRDLSNVEFEKEPTIIITSPPYANRYDYTRTYALELCFHFVRNFEELKAIRYGILRSHIESRLLDDEYPPHPAVKEVVELLKSKKLNNPRIPHMLTAYFVDMAQVIEQWYKVLSKGAKVAVVVDNVRFEGEMVPVDLILSEMAENVGFNVKEIIVARYKGNSSQQMKKYGRVPVRESILIWEK